MHDEIPLGRVAGFQVKVHWSVLVVLWLFTWSLATTLPGTVKGYAHLVYWIAGGCGAVVLLASLLGHELAHAVVARRCGVAVGGVTLWLFGGVTTLSGEAKTPKDDFRIAFAGPATSLLLSATFGMLAVGAAGIRVASVVVAVLWWLAVVNLLLGLFNLLPGAPLDGGRLVRALLWRRHGDLARAGIGAARAGRMLAFVLITLGLAEFLVGGMIGGVWLAFIGWFIFSAARDEENRISTRQLFAGVRVGDAMTAQPHTAPAWISVEDFIEHYVLGDRHSAYPVINRDGAIVGLVTLAQLREVAPDRRAGTMVGDIALALAEVPTAAPGEPLTDLLARMAPVGRRSRALVLDNGAVVGILTPSDIVRLHDVYRLASARLVSDDRDRG
ncbi:MULTISPECIES: site-2 protease family protein [Mycobacterium]|uniref:Zinc metalloprotease n=1 Tax=Mycobacterium kiyosense TaxID=2871094 RepID=A0A9P3Q5F3_9MYCO|nr:MULTISPECIES: site-2 protease family protein [Mycobacterium]BDB43261.1 putative zinc metalloprotease Rip3 [Mycobacterium kiyosense]BDE13541.1 putative zinc metalloprotease Rip3 [Mycobacterium sp. 20KCMC460]GLB85406.1 putative zinc metalloprotease Rip3 [Mycobacterium kiyosense]GLB88474.1 putative zinc metalloprotease Rip3 [Mycobacterium kiyosense]GLB98864.1 putative zinc metalloprotease Rip3 [Mycobacterium kiyosense]